MKAVTCPVILSGASTRADKSLTLRFSTPELDAKDKTAFFELLNCNLRMFLEPTDFAPTAKHEVKSAIETRTPSQRLRAVLFVLFKQQSEKGNLVGVSFDSFYTDYMNKQCEDVKSQLDPE